MQQSILLAVGIGCVLLFLKPLWSLRQNVAEAKKTGLPYVLARQSSTSCTFSSGAHAHTDCSTSLLAIQLMVAAYVENMDPHHPNTPRHVGGGLA